jgi:hypothetical protein
MENMKHDYLALKVTFGICGLVVNVLTSSFTLPEFLLSGDVSPVLKPSAGVRRSAELLSPSNLRHL